MGNNRPGLTHRKDRSRFMRRCSSSHALRRGPKVSAMGEGSMMVRWRMPALVPTAWWGEDGGAGVAKGPGVDAEEAETRQRWHSLRSAGREADGKRDGMEKAWIDTKFREA